MKDALIGVAVLLVAAVAVYVLLIDNPLRPGSVAAPDQANWLPELSAESEDGYVYRYVPGADFYGLTTIRNGSLLPVTILAPTPEELDLPGPNTVEYLVAGRIGADGGVGFAPVGESPRLQSETLAPGEELGIWIHWQMGPCDHGVPRYAEGGSVTMDVALVNWSVLGMRRTSWVPLAQNFETRNVDEDPDDTCAHHPS